MNGWLLLVVVVLAGCGTAAPREGAAPPVTPTADSAPPDADAATDAETEQQRLARLAAELDKLEMTPIAAYAGPSDADAGTGFGAPRLSPADAGAKVTGPKAKVTFVSITGGPGDAPATLLRGRAGFRRCQQRALDDNPEVAGELTLTIELGADGKVTSATVSPKQTLPSNLVLCIQKRAEALEFSASSAGAKVAAQMALAKE